MAVEQGDADAQVSLGQLYRGWLWGDYPGGLPKDYKEAEKWYRLAVDQVHPVAQAELGAMLVGSKDMRRNFPESLRLLRLASKQNFAPAQRSLGAMYMMGYCVDRDNVTPQMWFIIAASNTVSDDSATGSGSKQEAMSVFLAKSMSPEGISKGQAMATACVQSNYTDCGE